VAQAPDETTTPPEVLVWRAGTQLRAAAFAGMALVAIAIWLIWSKYALTATIAVVFGVGIIVFLWWGVVRPRLTAGPDGIEVVLGRTPTMVAWTDLRRAEAGPTGLTITVSGGTTVQSRWPQRDRGAKPTDVTEADRVAAYLVQRGEWTRRPKGPMPEFVPGPPPSKPGPPAKK
jgi:hypothetical protein